MNRKFVAGKAASYALAAIFFSMLVTFVACDVGAVRREALLRYEDNCAAVVRACAGRAAATIHSVQGLLMASAD
jgi:hypothetical protein